MKMASQRFCLRWNNHQSNMLSVFDQLLHAETFTDVTLAVDGQYLKAHKMVLSACSPYFNALFLNHPEKHPIVILKDVPYADMKSLLDFMYRGEVSVDQERLTAFLRVAESLRIKGLTEVNDDKPAPANSPPQPPQLQRIQPYLVQQHQQQQQNYRNKSGSIGSSNISASKLQAQQSMLSSALASMPKRKRGRPRKLSGSSNGTGNDYEEYDRDGTMNDSEMGDSKFGNDSFSGNDDASEDNQRDSGETGHDLNESHDSQSLKKVRKGKDKVQDIDENSTSGKRTNTPPELTERLLYTNKLHPEQSSTPAHEASIKSFTILTPFTQQHHCDTTKHWPLEKERECASVSQDQELNIPTVAGIKKRSIHKSYGHELEQQCKNNLKSLLNKQLPSSIRDIDGGEEQQPLVESLPPPSSSTLQQNFILHVATNPCVISNSDFFHQQQVQEQHVLVQQQVKQEVCERKEKVELRIDHNKELYTEHMVAEEAFGLGYKSLDQTDGSDPVHDQNCDPVITAVSAHSKNPTPLRTVQRRRIRRKAQSSTEDQAEHLTEMSVRGLDLFRYAFITEGVYQCTECAKENVQKTFKNKYSFQRHAFLYHEGKHRKVFPCPLCGKEFSRPDKMKNHMKMTHENYVSGKEISNFSPLNYLITATAAGDSQPPRFSQQQSQFSYHADEKYQFDENKHSSKQEKQYKSAVAAFSISLEDQQKRLQSTDNDKGMQDHSTGIAMNIPANALLQLQHEEVSRNGAGASPMLLPTKTQTKSECNSNAKDARQRLGEVK